MTRALLSLEQLLCVHHFGGQLHLEELELHLTPQVGQLDGDDGLGRWSGVLLTKTPLGSSGAELLRLNSAPELWSGVHRFTFDRRSCVLAVYRTSEARDTEVGKP